MDGIGCCAYIAVIARGVGGRGCGRVCGGERERDDDEIGKRRYLFECYLRCPLFRLGVGVENLCAPVGFRRQRVTDHPSSSKHITLRSARTTNTVLPTFPTVAAFSNPPEIAGVPYGALVSEPADPPNLWCKYRRRQNHLRDSAGSGIGSLWSQRVIPKAYKHRRYSGCGRFV